MIAFGYAPRRPRLSILVLLAVFDHTSGSLVSALSTPAVYHAPYPAGHAGCSVYASGPTIHDTLGNLPLCTSAARMSKKPPLWLTSVPVRAFSNSGLPGVAF